MIISGKVRRKVFSRVTVMSPATMLSSVRECVTSNLENIGHLVAAFAYGFCSVLMTFVNKTMLDTYGFDYPFFIMLSQMVFTLILFELLRLGGFIKLHSYTLTRGRSFFLPSLFYGLHSVLALSALTNMNIPMYSLMKRCTPFVTLFLGVVVLNKSLPSCRLVSAVAMITGGCVIAGYGDLAFDLVAYGYGAVSVAAQALYLTLVQKSGQEFTATETVHLNSYNNIPAMLLCSVAFSQFGEAVKDFDFRSPTFVILFLTVISLGCVLNFLLFLCTTMNSALTTSIVAAFKSNLSTLIGMFTFGGISINLFTLSGIMTNMVGGTWYTYIKYKESTEKQASSVPEDTKMHDSMVKQNSITNKSNGFIKVNIPEENSNRDGAR